MDLLLYCRAGYEADLLAELEQKLAVKNVYGYAKMTKNSAFLRFCIPQIEAVGNTLVSQNRNLPKLDDLVFARQKLLVIDDLKFEGEDRISELLSVLNSHDLPTFSEVFVEYADSEDGKQMAKFCKKFIVPLRNRLRQNGTSIQEAVKQTGFFTFVFSR